MTGLLGCQQRPVKNRQLPGDHNNNTTEALHTAYGVVKARKTFSDYELICEIQVKNGLDLGENYRNINGCKTFAASIAQTFVDKQVIFKILSY
jgi:hypothetical protein